MNQEQITALVKSLIQQYLTAAQYSAGGIPFHKHNGVDSPKIATTSTGGTPGGNDMDIQFNNAGAFGGSDNLTWDDADSILTIVGTLDVEGTIQSQTSTLDIAAIEGNSLTIETIASNPGDSGDLTIETGDAQSDGSDTQISGELDLKTGFGFGDAGDIKITAGQSLNGTGGDVQIQSGNSVNANGGKINLLSLKGATGGGDIDITSQGSTVITSNLDVTIKSDSGGTHSSPVTISSSTSTSGPSGDIDLTTGNTQTGNANDSGAINITTGATGETGTLAGVITLETGQQSDFGARSNVFVGGGSVILRSLKASPSSVGIKLTVDSNGSFLFESPARVADGTVVTGGLAIANAGNVPGSTPTSGGVLYVDSGALHWIGSSGTDTVIAPA